MSPVSATFRPSQIWLHWVVVVGVIVQIGFHDAIVDVVDAGVNGRVPASSDVIGAWVHVGVGSVIFAAVIARLVLRWRFGAPEHAPGTPPTRAIIASAMHLGLYGLLLAMGVTGALTWSGVAPLGRVHFAINIVLFFASLAHALAAIFNQFVRKDGTLARMMPRL